MMTMNRVTLLGYAGRNPEMRKLQSGDDVAQFSLATTERFRRRDETVGESTEWHSVVAFGAAAEAVRKLVRKGAPVLVEGRIASRTWTDRTTGAERRATEIVVSGPRGQVNVLARRRTGAGGDETRPAGRPRPARQAVPALRRAERRRTGLRKPAPPDPPPVRTLPSPARRAKALVRLRPGAMRPLLRPPRPAATRPSGPVTPPEHRLSAALSVRPRVPRRTPPAQRRQCRSRSRSGDRRGRRARRAVR